MYVLWQVVPVTSGMHRPSERSSQGSNETIGCGLNAQYAEQSSTCGSDCDDTCDMERAVACKWPTKERCRCSQWRKWSALTQLRRPRGKGAQGQGLAGCGVHLVNEPNDVWMTGAPMTALPPIPTPAPMPARTMVLAPVPRP